MANVDYAHGLMPITLGARIKRYGVDSSNGTRIGMYDPVALDNDGMCSKAAATGVILGVVVGVFSKLRVPLAYLATGTEGFLDVMDDPKALFVIQEDASATSSATYIGNNCDLSTASCSTTTGVSTVELTIDGITASTAQLRMMALWGDPKNAWGNHADIIVQINEHFYKATAGI